MNYRQSSLLSLSPMLDKGFAFVRITHVEEPTDESLKLVQSFSDGRHSYLVFLKI